MSIPKLNSKHWTLAAAVLIIVIVGGVWIVDAYRANNPKEEKKELVMWVDRGILESSRPIFEGRVTDLQKQIAEKEAAGERDITLILQLGNAYYTLGELGKAAEQYLDILSTHPNDTPAHENYAQTLLEMGDVEGAEEHWRKAISVQHNEMTYLKLAEMIMQNDPQRASEVQGLLEDGIANIGQTPGLLMGLGNWYRYQGKLEEAISHYEVASRMLPDDKSIKGEIEAMRNELHQKFLVETGQ